MIKMKQAKKMRLDKYLVHVGYGSRSEVQKLIRRRKVEVDLNIINKPEYLLDPENAQVTVEGVAIHYQSFYYFVLNKPAGVITATEDKKQATVIDLLDKIDQNKRLVPVGRLDKDTEGLLILTNDGSLVHKLLSPKKDVSKVYFAKVLGRMTNEDVKTFAEGMILEDSTQLLPATLEIISSGDISEVYITISEGKFHQVKRMVAKVGKEVIYLKRIKMGAFSLPEDIKPGEYRELTAKELSLLKGEEYCEKEV
jgi:16S rRNA pseudouridine516 synthase